MSIPAVIALAAAIMWGRKTFFASKSAPTSMIPALNPSLMTAIRSMLASAIASFATFFASSTL